MIDGSRKAGNSLVGKNARHGAWRAPATTPTFEGSIRFPTDVGAFSDGNWIPLFPKML
jgi:hypothetical protein